MIYALTFPMWAVNDNVSFSFYLMGKKRQQRPSTRRCVLPSLYYLWTATKKNHFPIEYAWNYSNRKPTQGGTTKFTDSVLLLPWDWVSVVPSFAPFEFAAEKRCLDFRFPKMRGCEKWAVIWRNFGLQFFGKRWKKFSGETGVGRSLWIYLIGIVVL